jgi:hypothetical protein
MKKLMLFSNAFVALCLSAQSYQWVQADKATSLGDGGITAQWEGDKVKSFTKTSSSDAVVTGDVLEFVSGGLVSLSSNSFTLDLPLVFNGGLTFSNSNYDVLPYYDGEPLSAKVEKKVFENMRLDDWEPRGCIYYNKEYPDLISSIHGTGYPFHIVRGEGTLSAQFQCKDDGYTKSVKVDFRQVGEDVWAKITHARYIRGYQYYGENLDTLEGSSPYSVAIDNAHEGRGYSVDYFDFKRVFEKYGSEVVVKDAVSSGGAITNGFGVNLVFSGNQALSSSGEYAGVFYNNEKLTFRDVKENELTLSGTMEGTQFSTISFETSDKESPVVIPGQIVRVIGEGKHMSTTKGEYTYFKQNQYQDVAENVSLFNVTNLTGIIYGDNVSKDENPHVYFVSNSVDKTSSFYQFQTHDQNWFKVIDVELNELFNTVNQSKLRVRVLDAKYCAWNNVPGVGDEKFGYILSLEDAQLKGGNTYNVVGYAINQIDVMYKMFSKPHRSNVALSGTNNVSCGVIEVAGSENHEMHLRLNNTESLPMNGRLNVRAGGIVDFAAAGVGMYAGYKKYSCLINIFPGGRITQSAEYVFGADGQIINNDGGVIEIGYGRPNPSPSYTHPSRDSKTYMQYLNLKNGARVTGVHYPRVAYSRQCRWISSGEGSNVVECGVTLTGADDGQESVFDIECSSDLIFNGPLVDYADLYQGLLLTNCVAQKYGPAKVIQNNINIVNAPVRIFEGAWVLGGEGLVDSGKVFELYGGTLELADGVNQSLDVIPLMTNLVCGVTLGEGSSLNLGKLSFVDEETSLAITGPKVNDGTRTSVKIETPLTEAQLKKIKYNDSKVEQDNEGYLRTTLSATVIIVR